MDTEAIHEIFRDFGPVRIRRMFGGQGVYRGELMFALEAAGELYLKADSETEGFFRHMGSRPFSHETRDGRISVMSYWLMPESALDDPDEAAQLARMALDAARRAKAAGGKKGRRQASRSTGKAAAEPSI